MSANEDLITVGNIIIQQGKTINNQFFIYGSEGETCIFLAIWCVCGGGGGASMIRLGLFCFPAILSPISMTMSNKETI